MNLEIEYKNVDGKEIYKFCEWLIPKIQEYFIANLEEDKLIKFNNYINLNNIIRWQNLPKEINIKNILIASIYNLIIKKYSNYYSIEIDPNINIPESYAKFIDIASLVDKGNLTLNSYPVLSRVMEYFANNINNYYQEYLKES